MPTSITPSNNSPSLKEIAQNLMIKEVPKFGNSFFYSLGFLSMISFMLLLATGIVLAFMGANWWLVDPLGQLIRSIHLWSTQAFVLFMLLHLCVVFSTSGFKKPRQLTWVLGVLMFFVALAETEFGYVLRGDFSSQWRSLQGADFYNGSGLGYLIDTLNYKQILGIHIAVIPLIIMGLLLGHYILVKALGIANPRPQLPEGIVVPANHKRLFIRGVILVGLIIVLAGIFPSPYLRPTTIKEIADTDPILMAKTLVAEFNRDSDTATYLDNINPYQYDVYHIYIATPYQEYLASHPGTVDQLAVFNRQSESTQASQLKSLEDNYSSDSPSLKAPVGPAGQVVDTLIVMAKAGLYEPALASVNDSNPSGNQTTYISRFLSDTGVLEDRATNLNLTTEQYGMLREESNTEPVGAWWLAPIGVLNHTILLGDANGDRDGAIIFGLTLLSMIAFPYIPGVNQIPSKLRLYKLFQHS